MADKDYYKILGVEKNATDDDLKSAFRRAAKQYHPDVNKTPEAEAKFKEINEAYAVLSDKQKRANYDKFGTADPGASGGFGGFGGGFSGFGGGGFDFNFGGFEDIFSMFGGGTSRSAQNRNAGADIEIKINLSFQEAAFGVKKRISITKVKQCGSCKGTGAQGGSALETCHKCGGSGQIRQTQNTLFGKMSTVTACPHCSGTGKIIKNPCSNCGGKGVVRSSEDVEIEIPAGIDNGQVLTVSGGGDAGKNGARNGDLHIICAVHEHPLLKRKNYDLYIDVYVPFTTLVLGGTVKVPLTKGVLNLTIPECTANGKTFRERNKGIKHLQRNMHGDLFITVYGEYPKNLSKEERKLVRELDDNIKKSNYEKTKNYENVVNSL